MYILFILKIIILKECVIYIYNNVIGCKFILLFILKILIQYKAKSFIDFISYKTQNTNESLSISKTIDNHLYINYENEINKLSQQLNEEKNKNQLLINENNKLKEIINKLNDEICDLKNLIKPSENNLIKNIKEIQNCSLSNNIKDKKEKNHDEKILTVKFISMDTQEIKNYCLECRNTDLFVRLEEKLCEDFPKLKDYEIYFENKAKRIKRFKTLDENDIKNNDSINLILNLDTINK